METVTSMQSVVITSQPHWGLGLGWCMKSLHCPGNIYPFPGMTIFYIIKYSLLSMGREYYSIKYSSFLSGDDEMALNVHCLARHFPSVLLLDIEKGLAVSTNFHKEQSF